jgi:flagellar hook-length control protein FliK
MDLAANFPIDLLAPSQAAPDRVAGRAALSVAGETAAASRAPPFGEVLALAGASRGSGEVLPSGGNALPRDIDHGRGEGDVARADFAALPLLVGDDTPLLLPFSFDAAAASGLGPPASSGMRPLASAELLAADFAEAARSAGTVRSGGALPAGTHEAPARAGSTADLRSAPGAPAPALPNGGAAPPAAELRRVPTALSAEPRDAAAVAPAAPAVVGALARYDTASRSSRAAEASAAPALGSSSAQAAAALDGPQASDALRRDFAAASTRDPSATPVPARVGTGGADRAADAVLTLDRHTGEGVHTLHLTSTTPGSVSAAAVGTPASTAAPQHEPLASHIRWMIDDRIGEARMTLNPPELGTVDVKISVLDDQTYVQLVASNAAAREELEQALPRLRELLSMAGLNLADATVSGGRDEAPRPHGGSHEMTNHLADVAAVDGSEPQHRAARRGDAQIDLYA